MDDGRTPFCAADGFLPWSTFARLVMRYDGDHRDEHRMFCHITQNWRGQPLDSRLAVVELIGFTTTKGGLTVDCALDERSYETGIRIKKSEMKLLAIEGDAFHPEWNYTVKPRPETSAVLICAPGMVRGAARHRLVGVVAGR